VERADFECVDELSDSSRGIGGHGSTGGHATFVTDTAARDADRVAVGGSAEEE